MDRKLSIGETAKVTGLSAKTIRYYESIGLLDAVKREENKYRVFSDEDIDRLLTVKKARSLGISITDIRKIVSKCMTDGCANAKQYVKNQLPQYISSIEQKILDLRQLKKQLESLQKNFKNNPENRTIFHEDEKCCEILEK